MYRIVVSDLKRIGRDKKTGKPRYNARICIYDEVTNKRVVDTARKVAASSDAEADRLARDEAEKLVPSSEGVRPKRGAKGKIASTWDTWIKSIRRVGTAKKWRSIGNARVKPELGDLEVRDMGPERWRQWFERQAATGVGKTYANDIRGAVQAFYEWCQRNNVAGVAHNPIDRSTRLGHRQRDQDPRAILARLRAEKEEDEKRHLELDQIARFLAVWQSAFPQTYKAWLVMSACALRSHELIGLEADSFDLRDPQAARVAVQQGVAHGELGPTKTNTKRYVDVPLSIVPTIRELIEAAPAVTYEGETHRFLFPRLDTSGRQRTQRAVAPVLHYHSLWRHVTAVKELAGIRTANATHLARHTARLLAAAAPEMATQHAFGHKSLAQHRKYGAAPKGLVGGAIDAQLAPMLPTGNVHVLKKRRVNPGVKKARK